MPRAARALAVLAALVLCACADVPTSGPVRQGSDLRLERPDLPVSSLADPPRRGASAEEVVRSFLRAGADFRDDHRIARLHLAPQARQQWRTGTRATVYDQTQAALTVGEEGTETVSVTGGEFASIDAEGSFRRSPPGSGIDRSFAMTRVDGEWRIASLEDGLLLSMLDVQENFRQVSLYFLSPSLNRLVPDTILLPELPGLSTKLVNRLLRGPTTGLRGGVTTAFPQGTELEVPSVPVRDGLVTVSLDATAQQAADDQREQMAAQIVWTVKQLGPEVLRVRITAGGEDLVASGVPSEQPRESWLVFDPDVLASTPSVYLVRDGRVGRVIDGDFGPVPGPAGAARPVVRSPAVSLDETQVAAVSADGRSLLAGRLGADASLEPVATGTDLAPPSWDPLGNLWFLDRATGALSVLPGGTAGAVPVEVPRLPGGRLTRIAVSRDGARLAMVTGSGSAARLLLATLDGVDQVGADTEDVARVSVIEAREVLPDLREVLDVAWADARTLAVLGSRDGLPVGPLYTTVDGYDVTPVQADAGLVGLAAAPPLRPQTSPLVVATADGQLQQLTLGRWELLGDGSEPAYPG